MTGIQWPAEAKAPPFDASAVRDFLSNIEVPKARSTDGPVVSIIIPSFNNAAFLEMAVKSAILQVGVRPEVLIVDDGSSDKSLELARKLASIYPNVKTIALGRNFGCYYARNIALLAATGEFVTLVDSDDIMHPERAVRQIGVLEKEAGAVATRSLGSRWTKDFSERISEPKGVENTLLFRRSLIDEIGYYDSVRYAGDSEFRERIVAMHGSESVPVVPDELYYLRSTENSLTEQTEAYAHSSCGIKVSLSDERFSYQFEYREWHQKCRADKRVPYIGFPQTHRPFELGASNQNASPSLGQDVVGGMATFPAREATLKATLPSILSQVDRLHVYLNGYEHIPDYLNVPKVNAILGKAARGDLRDNGKFFGLVDEKGYLFTFDDDIFYPPDYVARMVAAIEAYGRTAAIGVHGVTFPPYPADYLADRDVQIFHRAADARIVDLLGTGTTAFHSDTMKFTLTDFRSKGICDLWFARIAAEQSVPLINIERGANWLTEAETSPSETRLFWEAQNRENDHSTIFLKHLYPLVANGAARRRAWENLVSIMPPDRLNAMGINEPVEDP